jgi:hypothetical protein
MAAALTDGPLTPRAASLRVLETRSCPVNGRGQCPPAVRRWINISDNGDFIAIPRGLPRYFDGLTPISPLQSECSTCTRWRVTSPAPLRQLPSLRFSIVIRLPTPLTANDDHFSSVRTVVASPCGAHVITRPRPTPTAVFPVQTPIHIVIVCLTSEEVRSDAEKNVICAVSTERCAVKYTS